MDIVVILSDFTHSHNFHYPLVNSLTLLLFVVKKKKLSLYANNRGKKSWLLVKNQWMI